MLSWYKTDYLLGLLQNVGGEMPEGDPFTGLEFINLHLDLVKMRLAVHCAIDSQDFHEAVL